MVGRSESPPTGVDGRPGERGPGTVSRRRAAWARRAGASRRRQESKDRPAQPDRRRPPAPASDRSLPAGPDRVGAGSAAPQRVSCAARRRSTRRASATGARLARSGVARRRRSAAVGAVSVGRSRSAAPVTCGRRSRRPTVAAIHRPGAGSAAARRIAPTAAGRGSDVGAGSLAPGPGRRRDRIARGRRGRIRRRLRSRRGRNGRGGPGRRRLGAAGVTSVAGAAAAVVPAGSVATGASATAAVSAIAADASASQSTTASTRLSSGRGGRTARSRAGRDGRHFAGHGEPTKVLEPPSACRGTATTLPAAHRTGEPSPPKTTRSGRSAVMHPTPRGPRGIHGCATAAPGQAYDPPRPLARATTIQGR